MPLVPRLPDQQVLIRQLRRELDDLKRRATNDDPAIYPIKVFADDVATAAGDGAFIYVVTSDDRLHGLSLISCSAYVTTVSSAGAITVQLRKVGIADMLTVRITINPAEFSSDTATQPVIDGTYSLISTGDRIAIDVDAAGNNSMGLGVVLAFG